MSNTQAILWIQLLVSSNLSILLVVNNNKLWSKWILNKIKSNRLLIKTFKRMMERTISVMITIRWDNNRVNKDRSWNNSNVYKSRWGNVWVKSNRNKNNNSNKNNNNHNNNKNNNSKQLNFHKLFYLTKQPTTNHPILPHINNNQ